MEDHEKTTLINAWYESAKEDLKTAEELFGLKRYSGCLFFFHLTIEKILKAIFLKTHDTYPPYTHKLAKLVRDSKLNITKEQVGYLNEMSSFNVEARYDVLKEALYKKATRDFTSNYLEITRELFGFFKKLL